MEAVIENRKKPLNEIFWANCPLFLLENTEYSVLPATICFFTFSKTEHH